MYSDKAKTRTQVFRWILNELLLSLQQLHQDATMILQWIQHTGVRPTSLIPGSQEQAESRSVPTTPLRHQERDGQSTRQRKEHNPQIWAHRRWTSVFCMSVYVADSRRRQIMRVWGCFSYSFVWPFSVY